MRKYQRMPPDLQAQTVGTPHNQIHKENVRRDGHFVVRYPQSLKVSFEVLFFNTLAPDGRHVSHRFASITIGRNLQCSGPSPHPTPHQYSRADQYMHRAGPGLRPVGFDTWICICTGPGLFPKQIGRPARDRSGAYTYSAHKRARSARWRLGWIPF